MSEEGTPIPVLEDEPTDWETLRVTQWNDGDIEFARLPLEGNLVVSIGETPGVFVRVALTEKRTIINRIKWWCFCCVFPFRIVSWEASCK